MAGKKGVAVALQTEVNTEDEWQKLLEREGLVVVDVYSEWCGPCVGMVGNLKKLKLEIGSDYLHLAIAKSDGIEALERFRNKSEPTWMFIAGGSMVNLMFGANAPRLMKLITQELEKETKVLAGQRERQTIPFTELTQEEKNRQEEIKRKVEAEKEREARELAEALEELKVRNLTRFAKLLLDKTVMVYFPHMIDENNTCNAAYKMLAQYDQVFMTIHDQMEVQLTEEKIPEMFYDCDIKLSESFRASLIAKPCLVSLLMYHGATPIDSSPPQNLYLGLVEEKLASFVYGIMSHTEPPVMHTVAYNYQETREDGEVWPGVWTPLTYLSKASAVKVLFPHTLVTMEFVEDMLPPPRYCLIFEANRANEINDVIEEYQNDIMKVGFFDNMDAAIAKKVAKNVKQLEKLGPEKIKQTKMVMALAKRTSDPLLAFSQLTPLYISPDTKVGSKECDMFFPPPNIFEDEEEEGDEDIEGEDEEGEERQQEGEEGGEEGEGEEGEEHAAENGLDEKSLTSQDNVPKKGSATDSGTENPAEDQPAD